MTPLSALIAGMVFGVLITTAIVRFICGCHQVRIEREQAFWREAAHGHGRANFIIGNN